MSGGQDPSAPRGARSRADLLATAFEEDRRERFLGEVREGLGAASKRLSCRWFYDPAGSRLFEEICTLEEYYLPRAETEILRARSDQLAARLPPGTELVELGCGNSTKTRLLIEALSRRGSELELTLIDLSRAALEKSTRSLLADYPRLSVTAVHGEYGEGLERAGAAQRTPKLLVWLGSSIGNFDRAGAASFLASVTRLLSEQDHFLVGIDLRKDARVLEAAYDDARGVTARFNKNLLARINHELGGDFDLAQFEHRAHYDVELGRIEMYLVSKRAQRASLDGGQFAVSFRAGESIHTENSYKYSLAEIEELARAGGMRVLELWLDSERRFALVLFARAQA